MIMILTIIIIIIIMALIFIINSLIKWWWLIFLHRRNSPIGLLLRVRLVDGSEMQGPLQLHGSAEGPAAPYDVQRMLRQNGPQRQVS